MQRHYQTWAQLHGLTASFVTAFPTMQVAILKKLRAENIVRFLGVCEKESRTLLCAEFMAGGDLFNRLYEAERGAELSWGNL